MQPIRPAAVGQLTRILGPLMHGRGTRSTGTCLVIDADRTLAPQDTGRLVGARLGLNQVIRRLFEVNGYNEDAFSSVAEVWGGVPIERYLSEVRQVALEVAVYPTWKDILGAAEVRSRVVIVSSGIPQVWRLVLDRLGCPDIPIVGGCNARLDDFLVCPETKEEVVALLQKAGWTVIAAGDSPIDLPMLKRADIPLFVADSKGSPALREKLRQIPKVRHLIVDERRFDGLPTCTSEEVTRMMRQLGGPHVA
jgi:phosphoserine phosphatase